MSVWFRFQWEIRSGSASLLFAGAVLLGLGCLFVALSARDTFHAHRLATDGRMASATVTKKVVHPAAKGTSNTTYEVDYVFTTADGRHVASSDTVDPDTWERTEDRAPVEVQYSAGDPTINRIGPTTGVTAIAVMFLSVGCALGLLGASLLVKGLVALWAPPQSAGSDVSDAAADTGAVVSRGWSTVDGPPLLQYRVRVSPWIIIGGILLIVGVSFLLIGDLELRQGRLYKTGGSIATAMVVTKSSRVEARPQSAHSQQIHYDVGSRFTSYDGATVQGSDEVDLRTWQSIRERDPIQIVYLRDQPARSRLVANDPGAAPQQFIVLGRMLAAVGALSLSYGLFSVVRTRRQRRIDASIVG
jgi:hypothetical protein